MTRCPASARVGDHAYPNVLVAVECSACRAALVTSLSMASSSVCSIRISAPAGESHKAWHRLKILCATSLDRKTSLYFSTACLFFKRRPLPLRAVGSTPLDVKSSSSLMSTKSAQWSLYFKPPSYLQIYADLGCRVEKCRMNSGLPFCCFCKDLVKWRETHSDSLPSS